MKSIYTIIVLTLFLYSCQSEKEKIEKSCKESIEANVREQLKAATNVKSLDSLRIITVDTITEQIEIKVALRYIMSMVEYYKQMAELMAERAKTRRDIASIGSSIFGGSTLNKMQYEDAEADKENALKLLDTLTIYNDKMLELNDKYKKADSTKFLHFEATALCQVTKQDMTMRRDTLYYWLTPDFKIIERQDVIKKYIGNLYKH